MWSFKSLGRSAALFVVIAHACLAALAPGALQTRGASFSTTSSMTWTGPVITGTNIQGILVCGWISATAITANTPTWGTGVSMTAVPASSSSSSTEGVASFYIFSPASAASITFSTSGNWSSVFCEAEYFSSASQSIGAHNGHTLSAASSSGFSGSGTTSIAGEYVVDTVVQSGTSSTLSATSPSVRTSNGNSGSGPISWGASYQGPIASPSSVTMAWTSAGSGAWLESSISVPPATGSCTLMLLGVGGPC